MGQILNIEMVYVIRRNEDNNILISSFLPIPISEEDEQESEPVLYVFDWSYLDLAPSIRYYVVDPSIESCNTYLPEVLDFLETIKDLDSPPQHSLPKRIYDAKTKIATFNSSLESLIRIGVIDNIEVKPVCENILYDVDLFSQLYRNYPPDVYDLVNSWKCLSDEEKEAVEEIYRTTNLDKKEKLAQEYYIPMKFLPISLRIKPSNKEKLEPEYKNSEKIYEDDIDLAGLVASHFKEGDIFSSDYFENISRPIEEKYGKNIKIQDLNKYFEITRIPRKNLYKIVKKL